MQTVYDKKGQQLKLHGTLHFDKKKGTCKHKVILITIPRSGTHLCQAIFSRLFLHHVRVFPQLDHLGDYRHLTDADRHRLKRPHDVKKIPLHMSLQWMLSGQFTHTHLKYNSDAIDLLKKYDYKCFLVKRNLKSVLISHARQKQRDHRFFSDDPKEMMKLYIKHPVSNDIVKPVKQMFPWFYRNLYPVVSYEKLSGEMGPNEQKNELKFIVSKLGIDLNTLNLDRLISNSVNKKTFTYSGEKVKWQDYWSKEVEQWFKTVELFQINRGLGYD